MTRFRTAGACLCVAALALAGCSDDGDAAAKKQDATTTTSAKPSTSTSGSGSTPTQPRYTTLPAVAVGQASPLGANLFATVTKVEAMKLEARGPGDVAGPGVLVSLEIRNDTGKPINLNLLAVNASYGDGVPASPVLGAPGPRLSGRLAAGDAKTGRYEFGVPGGAKGQIVIDVQSSAFPNIVVVNAEA